VAAFLNDATILVTGGSGFLGRHCVEQLTRQGALVHTVAKNKFGHAPTGIVEHCVDLRSPANVEKLIGDVRPTHLLHCAWVTTPGAYRHSPENIDWLQAGVALVRAFGEHGGKHSCTVREDLGIKSNKKTSRMERF